MLRSSGVMGAAVTPAWCGTCLGLDHLQGLPALGGSTWFCWLSVSPAARRSREEGVDLSLVLPEGGLAGMLPAQTGVEEGLA